MFDDATAFHVSAQTHPLHCSLNCETREFQQGQTVAQIIHDFDFAERHGFPVVELVFNGRRALVPMEEWTKVRPRAGVFVEIYYPVHGPLAGALLSAIITSAAGTIATAAVGSLGAFAVSLATAAITVIGALVVNALIPPASTGAAGSQGDTNFAITGTANEQRPYGVFPRVLGRRRIFPPMTARGFTEVIDGEIYYRGRYTFGSGPVMLEDLRIGTTPISEFSDVEIEFLNVDEARTLAAIPDISEQVTAWRTGVEPMTLYPDDVAEDPESVRLLQHTPTVRFTRERCTSAQLDITFNQGLAHIKDTDDLREMSVDFHFTYRRVGDQDFIEAGQMTCTAAERSLVRFTHSIEFPAEGEYEVRVERLSEDSDDISRPDDSYLSAVRSFRTGQLPSHANISEISIRMRASEQLNGQVDSLNATVQQLAPIWDGAAWTEPQPVRHPAWIYASELMGAHLRRPRTTSELIVEDLKAWADQEPHWTFDYVIDTKMRVQDVLELVAPAGRARWGYVDGRYSIIRDGAAGAPRQIFTPRNSWGFKGEKVFSREIHGLRLRVRSERLEWEQDEITAYADGYGPHNASEFETLDLPGVVVTKDDLEVGNAWRLGRYHLAVNELRPEKFSFYSDWEHIRSTRGDKVSIVHDVPATGYSAARVKGVVTNAGQVQSLRLDEELDLPAGSYRMIARSALGEITHFGVTLAGGAWSVDGGGVPDHLVSAGDLLGVYDVTQETLDLVITAIEPGPNESALIRGVPASPAVLAADTGTIPTYDPVVTVVGGGFGPPLATVYQTVTGRAVAISGRNGVLTPRIGVDLIPRGYTEETKALLRWRRPGQQAWHVASPQSAIGTILTDALTDGENYQVEVQTVDAQGRGRGYVSAGTHQARARNFDYVAPVGWIASEGMDGITLYGEPYPYEDFAAFRIYGAAADSDDLTLLSTVSDPFFPYSGELSRFRISATDHSGNESPLTEFLTAVPRGVAVEDLGGSVMDLFNTINASITQVQTDIAEAVEAVGSVAANAANAALSEEAAATSAANAGSSAQASTAAADASAASATEAESSASAASVQRQQAQTARGQAETYAQQSAASAENADGAATAATQTLRVFARAGGQAGNLAPYHHEHDVATGTGWDRSHGDGIAGSPGGGDAVRLADVARMHPPYSGGLTSRRIRVRAWVETTAVTDHFRFCLRGGGGPDVAGILAYIGDSMSLGPGWHQVEVEATVTTSANFWYPAIDMGPSTDRVLIADMIWEDITDEHAIGQVEAAAQILQQAVADLEGNVAASITLQVVAGSSGARLELVADGGPSGARIDADNILLNGTVRTPHLAAGAVTADRLAIAFGGNLLRNSDLAEGLLGWELGKSGNVGNQSIMSLRPPGSWSGQTYSVLELRQNGTDTSGYADIRSVNFDASGNLDRRGIPIRGGQWYELSVQCSMHRTKLRLMIGWITEDGTWIGHASFGLPGWEDFAGVASDSSNPDNWPRYRVKCRAPSNAAFAQAFFRNEGTESGTSSVLFMHKPLFGETTEAAIEPMPWSPGPKTVIDGGGIRTNSVTAGMGIFNGPIGSGNYVAGVQGWSVDEDGNAEFANLASRSWMQVGSVSDGVTVVNPNARTLNNGHIITEKYLGATTLDQFWQIAVSLKYRARSKGNNGQIQSSGGNDGNWRNYVNRTQVRLQMRTKTGGTWSGWSTLHTWGYRDSTAWGQVNTVKNLHGVYEDVGLRLIADVDTRHSEGSSPTAAASYQNIDDYSLVARAVVR